MSEGLNRVILLGNLGADPELKYVANGQAVLNMRIATNESFLDRNKERQERTEWHSVVLFGARAEGLSKVLTKGSGLLIEGGLRTSSYEKDGVVRYRTEIVAREVCFSGKRPSASAEEEVRQPAPPPASPKRSGRNGHGAVQTELAQLEDIPF